MTWRNRPPLPGELVKVKRKVLEHDYELGLIIAYDQKWSYHQETRAYVWVSSINRVVWFNEWNIKDIDA